MSVAFDVRDATGADAPALAGIYNHYIRESTATFEVDEISADDMRARIAAITRAGRPWVVAEQDGVVEGYAYAGPFRDRAAYQNTVETTVYLAPHAVAKGAGGALYTRVLDGLRAQGAHVAVGVIALPNDASVALHERLGFVRTGTLPEVGRKFDEWIDVGFWTLRL